MSFFTIKQKEFMDLDYSTIDPEMIPILKTLSTQSDIVPLFSCEGHLEKLGDRRRIDSYIAFICKDANVVINAAHKLLSLYIELGVAINSHPHIGFSVLNYIPNRSLKYPTYTFRKYLTSKLEKEFWLKALNECFTN